MNIEIANLVLEDSGVTLGYETFVPAVYGLGNGSGPQSEDEKGKAPAKEYGKKKSQKPKPVTATQKPR